MAVSRCDRLSLLPYETIVRLLTPALETRAPLVSYGWHFVDHIAGTGERFGHW
jgi:hypothetical protein